MSLTLQGGTPDARERALVAAVGAGAEGGEERDDPARLIVFALEARGGAVQAALRAAVGGELEIGPPEPVADVAWSEAWKEGLEPVVVSPRLAVTPSFVPFEPAPGQTALVIDPGQAFGTGGHASTRLALELLAALPSPALEEARVLDVGCGTGVLGLAALALGAREVVALDLDPLACKATRDNAARNRLEAGLRVWTGPLAALSPQPFSLVLANLIRAELFPLLDEIRARCAPGARVILSGLLKEEEGLLKEARARLGLVPERTRRDRDGLGDHWLAAMWRA